MLLRKCRQCGDPFETERANRFYCDACAAIAKGQLPSTKVIRPKSKPKYSIRYVNREAMKRGISYGKMVVLLEGKQ